MSKPLKKKKRLTPAGEKPPAQEEETPENAPEAVAGDDRNLIDSDFETADFEEKVWLFWNRNKTKILLAIAVVFLAVVITQVQQIMDKQRIANLQADFITAMQSDDKTSFAAANSTEVLAAIPLLESADKAYEAKEFSEAQSLYNDAVTALANTPFAGRARLGAAMSDYLAGNQESGESTLRSLSTDANELDSYRAAAYYQLSIIALKKEDTEAANLALEALELLDFAGIYEMRASTLRNSYPQLSKSE